MIRSSFWIVIIYVLFSNTLNTVGAGLLDLLGTENQVPQRGRGLQSNLNLLQLLNGNNKPYDPNLNNNNNVRPYRPNSQYGEEIESLTNRLEKINKALEERNKQKNNNDNTHNDNNNNITHKPVPKPADNTDNDDNANTDNSDNENVVIGKRKWTKMTKSKFYFQVQPVVPEDERNALQQTVYYEN